MRLKNVQPPRSRRKDGSATRRRLVEAAGEVFAERGFRDATVGEICQRAGANQAAISYHFGGKDELYAAAWKAAFDHALDVYPADGDLGPDAGAEARLHALVSSLVHRILDNGRLGHAGRILTMEMMNPTESIAQVRSEAIAPFHELVRSIVSELLGERATDNTVTFTVMSIIHQCLALGFRAGRFPAFERYLELAAADVDALARHIATFSLGGIEALKREPGGAEDES